MTNRFRNRLLASTLLVGMAALTTPAMAQDARPPQSDPTAPAAGAGATDPGIQPQDAQGGAQSAEGEVVVTGTLIRNPNLVSSSPVNVVNDAEIIKRAPNNAEELLRSLPGVVPGVGTQTNNGSTGTNTVDLRGLGQQRNLVLLDGNRIVPSLANGATDLNLIPVALIQRVDVLTGGASTTYGADAVSGVVNFITRSDFSGVDLRAGYRITERGDGASFRADLTVGGNFADDRGNAVLSLGYTKLDPVYQIRDFAAFGIGSANGVASGSSFTSVPTTISFDAADLQLNPGSTALVPQYQGFNFNPFNIFQTPLERKSIYGSANYEVADNIEVYARGLFAQNTISSIIAPSGIFGLPLTIPSNNPFLTPGIRNQICSNQGIDPASAACTANPALPLPGVYRRLVELGPRISEYENNVYDVRAGVRLGLTETLKFDLAGSYGRSEQTQTQSGYVLNSRVQQALNSTNTTSCTVTTGGCVPLNLFGPAGSIAPAQVAFINGSSSIRINTELTQVRGLLSGDLGFAFSDGAEPVGFALGGEYRKYDYERIPDARAQDPSELGGAGGAIAPFSGGYNVKEAFGEVIAPIFAGLTVEGGARYSSYKIDGASGFDTFTYKGGATFDVFDGLRFRGNYQRAVRAPNIGELFSPTVTALTNLQTEPCVGAAPTTNAALRAVCIAQGAPAASIGAIQAPSAGQANATFISNINIQPEKADTFTVGAVITPRAFISGLTMSVDYYNITVNDAITNATPGDIIAACFGSITAASATSAACTGIRRNPANGRLSGPSATTFGLPSPLTNNGRLKTSGVDVTFNYNRQFGDVGFNFNFVGNWTNELRFRASPSSVDRECVGYFSANCGPSLGQIQPEFSFQQRTTVEVGGASLSLLWRFLDSVQYEGQAPDFAARGFLATNRNLFNGTITNAAGANSTVAGRNVNFNRIPVYHYFDLTAQFEVMRNFQLTLGVLNLLDKDPPITGAQAGSTGANSGNTFPSTYDPLGRTFAATVRLNF
ncbi:TonB-dependent receptor domain-containing protein [Sphingomonas sp.]|jgi:outer membrane receptor protein involved in Fe transport|uniref:TonB-dependent receptor domain-containing protein n=1 Tax=Sphingomonas sp. TaxID=28214 RepID=UPI002D80453D|nr:TonB-dependent receptor [Sphingomonas sp.]HEU0043071.1 TonB-dependent receptor [Sphingomonas sp.]